jgi:hypothetical protein
LAAAAGSMLLDFMSGFSDLSFNNKKSRLGMFGKALGAGVAAATAVDSTPLPTMEQPTRVINKDNPSLITITTQLEELVKTANRIGVYTKEQQEAILNQINQTKRNAKEQSLENKTPNVPESPQTADGNSLGPLDTSVNTLITKIDQLSDTVTDLSRGSLGSGGRGLSLLDLFGGKNNKVAQVGDAAKAKGPAWLSRAAAAITGGAMAVRKAVPVAMSSVSSKVAGLMSAGFGTVKKTGGSIKEAVKRAAAPLIAKGLGSTVLKSIPLVGLGIGAAFAVNRLMQGDVTGAGIELASGVGGPLTAVPALGASIARDTYASVYGVQPEQDPNFKQRYGEIKGVIDGMIKEQLSRAVKPKAIPTEREIGDTETPSNKPQPAPTRQPPAIPPVVPPTGASGGNGSTMAATKTPAAATGTGTSTSGRSAGAGSSVGQPMSPSSPVAAISPSPMERDPDKMSGATLKTAQEIGTADINQNYGFNPMTGGFVRQTSNTTRGGDSYGYGDIPSPFYNPPPGLEKLANSLFFGG